jgi:hypothetical protein
MVNFPRAVTSNSAAVAVGESLPSFVSGGDALPSATAFRHRSPRGRLCWSLSRLIPGGYTRAPLSFWWAPWDPGGYTRAGPSFLGVRFMSSRVIVKLQLENKLHAQVRYSVRRVKGLLGPSPLGLISRLLRVK